MGWAAGSGLPCQARRQSSLRWVSLHRALLGRVEPAEAWGAGGLLLLVGLVTATAVALRRTFAGWAAYEIQAAHRLRVATTPYPMSAAAPSRSRTSTTRCR